MNPLAFHVAGVTFQPGYPGTLHRLIDVLAEASAKAEPLVAILIRDPDNAQDRRAIEVHVPALGCKIGHVPREHAQQMAPLMDAGADYRAEVLSAGLAAGRHDRPGVTVVASLVNQGVAA